MNETSAPKRTIFHRLLRALGDSHDTVDGKLVDLQTCEFRRLSPSDLEVRTSSRHVEREAEEPGRVISRRSDPSKSKATAVNTTPFTEQAATIRAPAPIRILPHCPYSLAANLGSDHGRQVQTIERAGQCSILVECGHRRPQSREGDLEHHADQSCVRLCHHSSYYG